MSGEKHQKRFFLITNDKEFARETRTAFAASEMVELAVVDTPLTELRGELQGAECAAAIIDMDASRLEEIDALRRVTRRLDGAAPVIVVTREYNAGAVRILVQLQVADFLVKPISTADLVRACQRMLAGADRDANAESQIYTFMPAAGGVGNTTLALQTAFELHNSQQGGATTCVVDLNLQQGACAEYLDVEPRFDISEIENQPERLDRQLLDVMLSRHASGLAVLAAPVRPTEMRTFDTDVVVRMLDLVSAYFDNVVIDMPRTWFPWTETVLLGTNRLFVVSEMTVPCLRQTQRLIKAIQDTTARQARPAVIVNRFEQKMFDNGIRQADVEELLGEFFVGGIANNYKLVREAVDRGVPLQAIDANANVIRDLRRIITPEAAAPARAKSLFGLGLLRRRSA